MENSELKKKYKFLWKKFQKQQTGKANVYVGA